MLDIWSVLRVQLGISSTDNPQSPYADYAARRQALPCSNRCKSSERPRPWHRNRYLGYVRIWFSLLPIWNHVKVSVQANFFIGTLRMRTRQLLLLERISPPFSPRGSHQMSDSKSTMLTLNGLGLKIGLILFTSDVWWAASKIGRASSVKLFGKYTLPLISDKSWLGC